MSSTAFRRQDRGADHRQGRGRAPRQESGEASARGERRAWRRRSSGARRPRRRARGDARREDARLRAALRDPLQLAAKIAGALPAILRVLCQALPHDAVERGRRHGHDARDRRRLRRHDRRDQRRLARRRERLLPRRHLVQRRAEREDVRPAVRLLALELLRAPCTGTCRGSCLPASAPAASATRSGCPSPPAAPSPSPGRSRGASRPTSSASRWPASGPGARSPDGAPCQARPRSACRNEESVPGAADPSPGARTASLPRGSSMTRYSTSPSRPTS